MEERHEQTIAELETKLVSLHRIEMRLRSILASALVSPQNREIAREDLEDILTETREIENQVRVLEANQGPDNATH